MTPPEPPDEAEAPIRVGQFVDRNTVDGQVGAASNGLKKAIDALSVLEQWSVAQTTEALVALGYSEEEAGRLKSAMGEVPALAAAINGTSFLKLLWGTGL